MKLSAFRLKSYNERHVLSMALDLFRARYDDMYKQEVSALAQRISATECQPGGCELCNPAGNAPCGDSWLSEHEHKAPIKQED